MRTTSGVKVTGHVCIRNLWYGKSIRWDKEIVTENTQINKGMKLTSDTKTKDLNLLKLKKKKIYYVSKKFAYKEFEKEFLKEEVESFVSYVNLKH